MRIYLSGPISNDSAFMEHFAEHNKKLTELGHIVLDPTVWIRENLHLKYSEYMKLDLAMLELCHAIYMMPGWADSPGAKCELERARELGLKVYYSDHDNVPRKPIIYYKRTVKK